MKTVTLAFALFVAMTASAFAHAMLEASEPGAGSTVSPAPRTVVLHFSEDLEPTFSSAHVTDAGGHDVALSSSAKRNVMSVALKPLAAGAYRVAWHAVSVDTHRTQGAFTFTVKP